MKTIAALAFLCLLLGTLHASYLETCQVNTLDIPSVGSLGFIAVAMALVSFGIALAYMYAKTRQDPAMEVWSKDEAASLGITVLLFAGLLLFFSASCTIAQAYSEGDPFSISKSYLKSQLQLNGQNVLQQLTKDSIRNQMDATAYLYIGFTPFFGYGFAGNANLRSHSTQKELLIDLYLPIVASLNAQLYALDTLQWIGASILLPFAFVLRLVPFTREFGNVMIAVFFAAYIVVPTMYAMSAVIYQNEILDKPLACVDCTVHTFYTYGLDDSGAMREDMVFYKIGSTIPQAIFLPNLVIVVAITCISALSKALRAISV
jgi:hypothetical protein